MSDEMKARFAATMDERIERDKAEKARRAAQLSKDERTVNVLKVAVVIGIVLGGLALLVEFMQ